jgi:hypothetical protein
MGPHFVLGPHERLVRRTRAARRLEMHPALAKRGEMA